MRILHLRASNFYGGPERQLHLHALAARGSEFEIEVASFSEGGARPQFLDQVAEDGLQTHVLPVRNAYDLRAIGALRELLRKRRIDVLCSHDYRSNAVAWAARRGGGVRWLAFSRGFTLENLKVRAFQQLDRLLIRRADRIVAVSQGQERVLLRLGIDAARIHVVPNAIDVARLAAQPPLDLRVRHSLPAGSFVCISGGRFSREKGQLYLVRAAVLALVQRPELRFLLFGEGPDLPALQREVARHGRAREIGFPGFEPQMAQALRGADLLVNPSLSEGLPNIVLEAMACSTPVVATAVGGVPELIEDGLTGCLVPPGEPEALAAAILASANEPQAARERAAAALRRVESTYSFARQFELLADLYRRLG